MKNGTQVIIIGHVGHGVTAAVIEQLKEKGIVVVDSLNQEIEKEETFKLENHRINLPINEQPYILTDNRKSFSKKRKNRDRYTKKFF